MRRYRFQHDNDDPTPRAHQHCLDVEAATGLTLHNDDPANPRPVDGYVNTSSDGTIEVCLYEAIDVAWLDAMPEEVEQEVPELDDQGNPKLDDKGKPKRKKVKQRIKTKGFKARAHSEPEPQVRANIETALALKGYRKQA